MKKIDDIFTWQGFGNGFGRWESKCRIRFYEVEAKNLGIEQDGTVFVAIASELEDNKGTSITNCAENICILSINKYDIPFAQFAGWIEHYPASRSAFKKQEESFSLVKFDLLPVSNRLNPNSKSVKFANPKWTPLKKAHVELMLGEPIGD